MFSRVWFSDFVVGQKDCATTAFRCRFADAETATVGVGRSTALAIIKSRQSPCRAGALVGGGWRRRGILKVPLCKRGFLRLRAQGETDSHASDIGHWLGMTVLRAGGATAGRRTLRRLSLRGVPQGHLLRGAKRRGNPFSYTRGTDSHASVHPKGTCFAASTGSE